MVRLTLEIPSEFGPPSRILVEMGNVIYPKTCKRQSDFGQILDPQSTKDYFSRTSEK